MSYKSMYKAAAKFAKNCHLDNAPSVPGGRVGIAGANYYHHPEDPDGALRQYVTNGYYGVSYSVPLPDLMEADKKSAIPYDKMLFISKPEEIRDAYKTFQLPEYNEVKEAWKKEKKRCVGRPEDRNRCWRLADDGNGSAVHNYVIVDIEYLIGLMEITDCTGGEVAYWLNAVSPVYVARRSETPDGQICNVDGIILPVRADGNKKCLNDKEKSKMTFLWGKTASDFVNQSCN